MNDATSASLAHRLHEGSDRMLEIAPAVDESSARVLALVVAANGHIDERELQALDRLDAFRRLGVTRRRFVELARACIDAVGVGLRKQPWLRTAQAAYVDALIDEVRELSNRLIVCRFAAAVVVADGRVTRDERLVYDRVLSRWHISQMMVCRAIMADPAR
jgi:tellurite resistance protein